MPALSHPIRVARITSAWPCDGKRPRTAGWFGRAKFRIANKHSQRPRATRPRTGGGQRPVFTGRDGWFGSSTVNRCSSRNGGSKTRTGLPLWSAIICGARLRRHPAPGAAGCLWQDERMLHLARAIVVSNSGAWITRPVSALPCSPDCSIGAIPWSTCSRQPSSAGTGWAGGSSGAGSAGRVDHRFRQN
jgi:hypothetical protein